MSRINETKRRNSRKCVESDVRLGYAMFIKANLKLEAISRPKPFKRNLALYCIKNGIDYERGRDRTGPPVC